MADDTMAKLVEAGMFRILQPARFGGFQLGAEVFCRAMIEIARGDAAAGWVTCLTSAHTKWAGFYPLEGQAELYADDGDLRMPQMVAPQGTASVVDGGLVVQGSWDYVSGCDVSNWLAVHALVQAEGPDQPPVGLVSCAIGRHEYDVEDNWHVEAMRGTGSKRALVDGVFVPDRRVIWIGASGEPEKPDVLDGPDEGLYRAPMMPLFACELGCVAVGAGRGFIELFSERAQVKTSPFPPFGRLADNDAVQARLARSMVMLDRAETVLLAAAAEYDRRAALADPSYNDIDLRRMLLAIQQIVLDVCAAVDALVTVAGSSMTREREPLMRFWRDLTSIRTHYLLDSDRTALNLGRVLVGLEPRTRN